MSKRKHTSDTEFHPTLHNYQDEVYRALKTVKGFERQRLSKRLRDDGLQPPKQERLKQEVAVLKSLDLRQTARVHLISSLLKIKPIANSSHLPDELRAGIYKPALSENERFALHNVTSALYNKDPVKQIVEKAIAAICQTLGVSPANTAKRSRTKQLSGKTETKADRQKREKAPKSLSGSKFEDVFSEESDFEGFDTNDDETCSVDKEAVDETEASNHLSLLGSSSGDDDDDGIDIDRLAKYRGIEKVNLDDISDSGSCSIDADEKCFEEPLHLCNSAEANAKKVAGKSTSKETTAGRARNSTFLPSLMGGYVSGSESGSDVDYVKPKKRRGQRARQAIWEKRYGANAKHLQKQNIKGGRDKGWDMRRGAVNAEEHSRRTPWKKGVRNPLWKQNNDDDNSRKVQSLTKPDYKPIKPNDQRPIHPSWEAKKKSQDAQKNMAFAGQKIVFD